MLNRIIIMGRLARDPELRRTQTGTPVASFRLAVDRDFKDRNTGEKATDWIDVVAWRQTAEFVSRYFTKGRMAVVEGRLQMRDWTDKDGNKRTSLTLANKILLQAAAGVLTLRDQNMEQFNEALLHYYDTAEAEPLKAFLYENAIQGLELHS